MKKYFFLIILLIYLISCSKEKIEICESQNILELRSEILGLYEGYIHHQTIDLIDEVCFISRDEILILPYDLSTEHYRLQDQYNFNGVVINEIDTIVQRGNTFYRFDPIRREFSYLYSPPFTIHDFCVTPGHGIGYFWGNVFVEPVKFNYYNFDQGSNRTIFKYSEIIQDSLGPYWEYQTYLLNNELHLLMRTANNSNFLSTTGVFYDINIDNIQVQSRVEYQNKSIGEILDYNDFENIDISYGVNDHGMVETYNWLSEKTKNGYSFPIKWHGSKYYIDGDYLSISLHSTSSEKETKYINWKTNEVLFSIDTPIEYQTAFVDVRHYQDEYLLLFQQKNDVILIYDKNGCNFIKLVANRNVQDIMHLDSEKVIIRNDQNQIELFRIH